MPVGTIIMIDDGSGTFTPHLALTYSRNLLAEDLTFIVQSSSNLVTWVDLENPPATSVDQGNGTRLITHAAATLTSASAQFFRLQVIRN